MQLVFKIAVEARREGAHWRGRAPGVPTEESVVDAAQLILAKPGLYFTYFTLRFNVVRRPFTFLVRTLPWIESHNFCESCLQNCCKDFAWRALNSNLAVTGWIRAPPPLLVQRLFAVNLPSLWELSQTSV